MTVQELIEALERCVQKDAEVVTFDCSYNPPYLGFNSVIEDTEGLVKLL